MEALRISLKLQRGFEHDGPNLIGERCQRREIALERCPAVAEFQKMRDETRAFKRKPELSGVPACHFRVSACLSRRWKLAFTSTVSNRVA